MGTFWKVMLGLILVLPVAAYVAGSLVASSADHPVDRAPIVINDPPSPSPDPTPAADDASPGGGVTRPGSGAGPAADENVDENDVEVVLPPPTRVGGDDDDGDDRDDRDEDDDDDRDDVGDDDGHDDGDDGDD